MNFRYDINGLRAIAVLAVVLFHFNPTWLPGGFAGVDVFFVISGFLMTSIIFTGIEKNNFNLFRFYNARANRIIPVLAALSVVLVLFGVFYLISSDLKNLGKQIQQSSLFASNVLFAKGGGYFDTGEKSKWLLHTWSLSVEWQFYIFFPIIVLFLKRYFSISNIKKIILTLFIISFFYCIYATYKNSQTAYFLLSSRAWEMIFGGLAFLYPFNIKSSKSKKILQTIGITLIAISYVIISEHTPWPGYMALLPVLGTYLIILSNIQNSYLVNNPIFNSIGKWSYSIYVWHWPIVVLGTYFSLQHWWLYGIPLSILLGFLSYQIIELRKFSTFNSWKDIYKVKPVYMFLFVLGLSTLIKETDGLSFIYPTKVINILNESANSNPYKCDTWDKNNILEECKIGNPNNIKAIVIGDSHADAITTALTTTLNLKTEGIISIVTGGCPFLFGANFESNKMNFCHRLNQDRMQWLLSNKHKYHNIPLIISARWANTVKGENSPERINGQNLPSLFSSKNPDANLLSIFSNKLNGTIRPIVAYYKIYIVHPIPEIGQNVPKVMAKALYLNQSMQPLLSYQDYLSRSGDIRSIIEATAKRYDIKVLDPAAYLCRFEHCMYESNGRPIYRDADHLSEYGNKFLTSMFTNASF